MIETQGLTKRFKVHKRPPGLWAAMRSVFHRPYEVVTAVHDLTISIQAGERVGFLGPNGAGKTTTLKMLSGLLYPSAGTVRVAGFQPQTRTPSFLRSITLVMGQKQQLLWDLPPAETFALNRAVYDVPKAQFDETLSELDRLLGLGDLVEKPTRQLSLGERMKCELAAALLHRPRILFLDEPTIGLDVSMQATLRSFVRDYNERFNATVLLTSHYMDDVTALCPRVIVIDQGKLRYDGDLRELVRSVRPEKRVIATLQRAIDRADAEKLGVEVAEQTEATLTLRVPQNRLREVVAQALHLLPITDLTVEDPPLEEVMRELFARAATEDGERRPEP
jgi:ABC-2 type transport system ATP-binding protein